MRPTEIDRHGHVNHVHYLTWVEDHARTIDPGCPPLRFVRLFYDADARTDDDLLLTVHQVEDATYHRVHRGETSILRALVHRAE